MTKPLKKNNPSKIEKELEAGKNHKTKLIAMLAPSFVADFNYPEIISQLKELGFDKVVELTFGAKLVNREYHKLLQSSGEKMLIASVCPGIVSFVKQKYPSYVKNLMPVDSPMIAMSKVCKKTFPKHKIFFISPCVFKKIEAENSTFVDYVIDYLQLKELFKKYNIKPNNKREIFDKFYNDYTKVYPLSGGLSKTAHIKGILHQDSSIVLDGIRAFDMFLKKKRGNIKFIDSCFCIGGCIGGPCLSRDKNLEQKRKRLLNYLEIARHECIPKLRKGLINKAKGIDFSKKY